MGKIEVIFEKFAALIFLFILVGLIGFLVYVPMPLSNEKVVLIIIGSLTTTATSALPKLFGSDDRKEKELQRQLGNMEMKLKEVQAEYTTIKKQYDQIVSMLVDRHVIKVGK